MTAKVTNTTQWVADRIKRPNQSAPPSMDQIKFYLANLEIWEKFPALEPTSYVQKVKDMYVARGGVWTPTLEICSDAYYKVANQSKNGLQAVAESLVAGKNALHQQLVDIWTLRGFQSFQDYYSTLKERASDLGDKIVHSERAAPLKEKAVQFKDKAAELGERIVNSERGAPIKERAVQIRDKIRQQELDQYLEQIKVFYSVAVSARIQHYVAAGKEQLSNMRQSAVDKLPNYKGMTQVVVDYVSLSGSALLDHKSLQSVRGYVVSAYGTLQQKTSTQMTLRKAQLTELSAKVQDSNYPERVKKIMMKGLARLERQDTENYIEAKWAKLDYDQDGEVKVKDLVYATGELWRLVTSLFKKAPKKDDDQGSQEKLSEEPELVAAQLQAQPDPNVVLSKEKDVAPVLEASASVKDEASHKTFEIEPVVAEKNVESMVADLVQE